MIQRQCIPGFCRIQHIFCGDRITVSTYTKTVILDENGAIVAANTIKSKINSAQSAKAGLDQAIADAGLKEISDLTYLIGTGYGRNKVPQADENISEISCHAMGVHVTDPSVRAIIDIGGQDVKGIAVDTDGTVKTFAMNDKCAAGTGRFFESMANAFEMSLEEFSKLSLTAENVIPITAQCTVFAESEVITLVGEGKPQNEIAAGIQQAVAKRCFVMAKKAGAKEVHVRISSPPFLHPCFFGTDVPSNEQLIAHTHTQEEIRQLIGADSLGYMEIEKLKDMVGDLKYCDACFTVKSD